MRGRGDERKGLRGERLKVQESKYEGWQGGKRE